MGGPFWWTTPYCRTTSPIKRQRDVYLVDWSMNSVALMQAIELELPLTQTDLDLPRPDGSFFAGLYAPPGRFGRPSCSIAITEACDQTRHIHDCMPVILWIR